MIGNKQACKLLLTQNSNESLNTGVDYLEEQRGG
jgi:hypothetical protein